MSDLSYSSEAINVLNKFYRVDAVIYVEAEDDEIFWNEIFSKSSNLTVEYIIAGDCNQVDKAIDKIISGELNAIAARDKDYLELIGATRSHPRVIYTYGHSIENSILSTNCIAELTKLACKDTKYDHADCHDWLKTFSTAFRGLLVMEVANEIGKFGKTIMGENCSRFMVSSSSEKPCSKKIRDHEDRIKEGIDKSIIQKSLSLTPSETNKTWAALRGHFVMSGVQKFIVSRMKKRGRKSSMSLDQIFSNAIFHFRTTFNSDHTEFDYYDQKVRLAESTFPTSC